MKLQDFLKNSTNQLNKPIQIEKVIKFDFNNISFGQEFIIDDKSYYYLGKADYEYGAEHYFFCQLVYRKVIGLDNIFDCDINMFKLRDFGDYGFDIISLKT